MKINEWAALVGAAFGVIFTRIPYMQDGNLLITTVCVIFFASISSLFWGLFKRLTDRQNSDHNSSR